jgi:hypothetical protein
MSNPNYIWTPTGYSQLGQSKEKDDKFRELHIYTPWNESETCLPFTNASPGGLVLPLQLTLMKIDGDYSVDDFDTSFEKKGKRNLAINGLLRWTAHFKHGGCGLGEAYIHSNRFVAGTYAQDISSIALNGTADLSKWLTGIQNSLELYLRGVSPFTSEYMKSFMQNSNLEPEYQERFNIF